VLVPSQGQRANRGGWRKGAASWGVVPPCSMGDDGPSGMASEAQVGEGGRGRGRGRSAGHVWVQLVHA
jgi:hypothetical protein